MLVVGSGVSEGVTEDGTIIGDIEILNLNVVADKDVLREEARPCLPASVQSVQIEDGMMLFGFDLNAVLAVHGDNGQIYVAPASREVRTVIIDVDIFGPRNEGEMVVGQQLGVVEQNHTGMIVDWDSPGRVVKNSRLGSDPFNLMPIIEHNQRLRKKRPRRGRRGGSMSSSLMSNARERRDVMLSVLGKRMTRDDEAVFSQIEGRGRLNVNMMQNSSAAEVDKGQPHRKQ